MHFFRAGLRPIYRAGRFSPPIRPPRPKKAPTPPQGRRRSKSACGIRRTSGRPNTRNSRYASGWKPCRNAITIDVPVRFIMQLNTIWWQGVALHMVRYGDVGVGISNLWVEPAHFWVLYERCSQHMNQMCLLGFAALRNNLPRARIVRKDLLETRAVRIRLLALAAVRSDLLGMAAVRDMPRRQLYGIVGLAWF